MQIIPGTLLWTFRVYRDLFLGGMRGEPHCQKTWESGSAVSGALYAHHHHIQLILNLI